MIYSVSLFAVGLVVGLALLAFHLLAVAKPVATEQWLRTFPRSRVAGTVLIAIAGVWSFLLVRTMDLGEFGPMRTIILAGIGAGTFLAWRYMEEFLAVRALGMLALLAAEPILSAAFLRPEQSRLLIVVLAYAWIVLGLFWVGMPWVLRDQITWVTARRNRFQAAAWGGVVYGALVLACAVLIWK